MVCVQFLRLRSPLESVKIAGPRGRRHQALSDRLLFIFFGIVRSLLNFRLYILIYSGQGHWRKCQAYRTLRKAQHIKGRVMDKPGTSTMWPIHKNYSPGNS